jgi:hypothetical protein
MNALLLPPGKSALVLYNGPRPDATHRVEFWWRRDHRHEHDELLGCVTCAWNDTTDGRRMAHLKTRLYLTLRADWQRLRVDVRPLEEADYTRRTLTDLQRFRRKMGQVLRTYAEEKAKAMRGELGLPEMAIERLDTELEHAWQKAERIYKCSRTDFNPTALSA